MDIYNNTKMHTSMKTYNKHIQRKIYKHIIQVIISQ